MKLVLAFACCLITAQAYAISGGCRGMYQGQEVLVEVYGEGNDPRNSTGNVSVDGRHVSSFDGRDANINYLFQTAKVTNPQGDLAEGRVTNLPGLMGTITRLQVQAYGIDFRNIPMQCWMN